MKVCYKIVLPFLLLILSVTASAEDIFQSSSEALDKLSTSVTKLTLKNGLRVLIYPRTQAPVFAGVVSVGVGGVDEKAGSTGISHMFEHMAFKGTSEIGTFNFEKEKVLLDRLETISKDKPSEELIQIYRELKSLWNNEQFSREFEKRGSVGLNAQTDKEETRYFVSMPKNAFEFWCWIESERLLHPVMRQFYQERDVVLEERRNRFEDDPLGRLYETLLSHAYLRHPYRNPVIGFEKDIRNLTALQLDAFRKEYYVPENIVVGVVGDIDLDEDRAVIERYFGRLPSGKRPERILEAEPAQKEERRFSVYANGSPAFMVAYHKPNYPSSDDPKVTVMSSVLNGSSQSPLFKTLIKDLQVASSVSHEEGPGVLSPNLLLFSVNPKSGRTSESVLKDFDDVIHKFQNGPISAKLLKNAKREIAFEYLTQLKSNITLASNLASTELGYNDWRAMLDWYSQAMQVTTKDVQEVARKYLVNKNRTVGFLRTQRSK